MTSFAGLHDKVGAIAGFSIRRVCFFACIASILLVLPVLAVPTNRYVVVSGGSFTAPYDTWSKAGNSANFAAVVTYANGLNEGDTVYVSNGVYTLSAGISVGNTIVKNFSSSRTDTTVNGAGLYTCFTLTHSNAVVDGLTITNGYSASYGGGISMSAAGGTVTNCTIALCRAVSGGGGVYMAGTGTVQNCTIVSNVSLADGGGVRGTLPDSRVISSTLSWNRADNQGGGMYSGTLTNCMISYNTVLKSGAVMTGGGGSWNSYIYNSTLRSNQAPFGGGYFKRDYPGPIVSNCLIEGNTATTNGGGIYFLSYYDGGGGEISTCTIRGNSSVLDGGGVGFTYLYYTSIGRATLRNCLITGNSAGNNGGGVFGGAGVGNRGDYVLWNCTIVSNTATTGGGIYFTLDRLTAVNVISYFNTGGTSSNWGGTAAKMSFTNSCTAPTNGLSGANNTALDPQFVSLSGGNYRPIKGSPCINAGTNDYSWMNGAVDLSGHARIVDGTVDMGAYEWFPMGTVFKIH